MALTYEPQIGFPAGQIVSVPDPTDASVPNKNALIPAVTVVSASGASPPAGTQADPTFTSAQSRGSGTLATGQQSVATTAGGTLIAAARTGRNAITITNITGAQQVYIGNSGVSATTGTLIPAAVGASITLPFAGAVYGIAVTAAQNVSFAETY